MDLSPFMEDHRDIVKISQFRWPINLLQPIERKG